MTHLMIVESGAKCRTIEKYLKEIQEASAIGTFRVIACFGHIVDLPTSTSGYDPKTWELDYQILGHKKLTFAKLQQEAKGVARIWLATDPDREGEAIAWHLQRCLKLPKEKFVRIVFHEITKEAIRRAIMEPKQIDMDLVHAQESRRALDRIVGYDISPLLWKHLGNNRLSGGRVQSAALQLIVDRDRHVDGPIAWKGEGDFDGNACIWDQEIGGNPDGAKRLLIESWRKAKWTMKTEFTVALEHPPPAFKTSDFQQDCFYSLRLGTDASMKIAQSLYEKGYITYMRTDSTSLSQHALKDISRWIQENIGEKWLHVRGTGTKGKEAHEAIRPTSLTKIPEDGQEKAVYMRIWRRAIASQMPPAKYGVVTYRVTSDIIPGTWTGSARVLLEEGYLRIASPDKKPVGGFELRPSQQATVSCTAIRLVPYVQQKKALFTEGGLIQELERTGIGRPSTYASIVSKLFQKEYIELTKETKKAPGIVYSLSENSGWRQKEIQLTLSEKGRIQGTKLGRDVCKKLQEWVPFIMSSQFTCRMEEDLDRISRGDATKKGVLDMFYNKWRPCIEQHAQSTKEWTVQTTRFGPCLVKQDRSRYIDLKPYLEWKKKDKSQLTETEIDLLASLPRVLENDDELCYGRYGFYLKKDGRNVRLPETEWAKYLGA